MAAQLELLSQHTTPISSDNATAPSRGARPQAAKPPSASPAHGYSNGTNSPPSDVLPPIVNNSSSNNNADPEAHIHPDLRAARDVHAPDVNMMPAGPPPPQQAAPPVTAAGPSTAPPPPTHPASTAMALDDGGAGSKAKRELSQSKRAAQNRAAQVCLDTVCAGSPGARDWCRSQELSRCLLRHLGRLTAVPSVQAHLTRPRP